MAIHLQNNPVDKNPTPPHKIPEYENLEGLVCGSKEEDPRDVVLFGDQAIFTFSIALASLRVNGPSGMTTACYKQNLINPSKYGPLTTLPDFNERKRESLEWCITNGGSFQECAPRYGRTNWGLRLSDAEKFANMKAVLSVPDFSLTWRNDIDALKLEIPLDLVVTGKVVWLQCPWVPGPYDEVNGSSGTSRLIQDFMTEIKDKQKAGDYLLLGIANDRMYFEYYYLAEILGENPGDKIIFGYRFQGGDEKLIKKILGHGYKHEAYENDIHRFIFHNHVTLVFKREGNLAGMIGRAGITNDPLVTRVTTKEVVVFKEEDHSFSEALAELHDKKSDGISVGNPEDLSDDLFISKVNQCISTGEKDQLYTSKIIKNITSQISQIKGFYAGKVVWYQLPPSCEVKMEQIESFMRNIGRKQAAGDYLLIGTTTSSQFIDLKIEEMIGDGNEGHAYNGYKFIRIDDKLINMLTAHGYKHGSTDAKVLVYEKQEENKHNN